MRTKRDMGCNSLMGVVIWSGDHLVEHVMNEEMMASKGFQILMFGTLP